VQKSCLGIVYKILLILTLILYSKYYLCFIGLEKLSILLKIS
jgi:hypothetical protein